MTQSFIKPYRPARWIQSGLENQHDFLTLQRMTLHQLANSHLAAQMNELARKANPAPQNLIAAFNSAITAAIVELNTAAQEGGEGM